ncbi:BON domain-containing protein [Providencia stuartii]|uniref:BON domain-containing protein n=2 Tax=Providencia TaxID=586 RepID=A0A1S1HTT1_PROST|nr:MULTISPECIES: BON domain-containing protein [Providencia]MDV5227514.1 BON domain-containing protein [Providencia rettgeri]ELR5041227.1 BON domain-containing protein [Providencia stuartii]ELR5081854.1 BON domain-containing protein [Providencia stuartii]ELR5113653.1 BON domain-containing protein [Providencia stuartii]ELR5299704.1 BON domain-containing protein [Providencia stuartii]
MKNSVLLRSLLVIGLSGSLFACSAPLKEQASDTWDSAVKTADIAGKDTSEAVSSGVKSTDNYIDDSSITAQVKSKLLTTSGIDSNSISVKTVKGVVYLSGFVKSDSQVDKVVQVVSMVNGVKSVQNGLVVAN